MTSVVKITEVVQALADRIAAGADTTSAGTSPNHQLKAAMVAKGYFQAGQGGGIPTPYPDKKFLSNNGTELEWRTASPDVDEPTGDGDILIIKEGRPVWGNLIPKPYVAGQVLSNNGTQLEWHALPDDRLPPIDPGEDAKILVIENGVVEWRTLSSGGITLPDTTGRDGKLLTTNGAPLSEGGGLFWGVPAGAPGSGTPGSLIGYSQAYSTEEFTFSAMVYPDHASATSAEQEVALAPVIRWGNNNVVTLDDGETPAGTWVADGVFEFCRDCFATLYITQHAIAVEFDETTGTTALPELLVVHQRPFTLDGATRYDSDIVGAIVGRHFTEPYGVNKPPPTIGGSISCSLTASAGDLVSLRGLVTVSGGTGGEIRYGAMSASTRTRPNFGILIMEAFPWASMPEPVATPEPK